MMMPRPRVERLRARLQASARLPERQLWGYRRAAPLADLASATFLGDSRRALTGLCVLVRVSDMLSAATALIELDGLARRLILCPPDLKSEDLGSVISTAEVEAALVDGPAPELAGFGLTLVQLSTSPTPLGPPTSPEIDTEWVLFTSGTSGGPKMVVHDLAGLTGAIKPPATHGEAPVWATFYDIRRYGGLQILLRALSGEGSMVLADPDEDVADFLARLGRHGVTHLTGTPSHWRRVLMCPARGMISPRYIRLSGEIADQAVLDALKSAYPGVPVAHAFASTEAGVGFEVNDGLEGFPAGLLDQRGGEVEIRVADDSLRLRSTRTATRYLGDGPGPLMDAAGFVDTGDLVERRGERFLFVGRRGGVINVGGLKVHPEEVEAVINRHPAVAASRVRGRRNPITGAIVVAEVMLDRSGGEADEARLKQEILTACRENLATFKVPAQVSFVPSIGLSAGGKLVRTDA